MALNFTPHLLQIVALVIRAARDILKFHFVDNVDHLVLLKSFNFFFFFDNVSTNKPTTKPLLFIALYIYYNTKTMALLPLRIQLQSNCKQQ